MGAMIFPPSNAFPTARRLSRSSQSSAGSRNSLTSARSAASGMSEQELDNFRSMRGKSAGNFLDSAYSMVDDVFDLDDRLTDVKRRGELQKRVVDVTGQSYSILITATDVRLQHNDEKGNYHYLHFGSEKPAKTARHLGERRDPERVKERWHLIDDHDSGHVFARITPKKVTINHSDGVWRVCRVAGVVLELRDSDNLRHTSKKVPRPGGSGGEKADQIKVFNLYGANDHLIDNIKDISDEPLLCANTPGERNHSGRHPRAHQSYYHDL